MIDPYLSIIEAWANSPLHSSNNGPLSYRSGEYKRQFFLYDIVLFGSNNNRIKAKPEVTPVN